MSHTTNALPLRAHNTKRNGKPHDVHVENHDHEIHITIDDRHYRIRGLEKNLSPQQLRVNILAWRDDLVHMDTLDLCLARSRASFIKATASELYVDEQVIKKDVGKLLLELEKLQYDNIEATLRVDHSRIEMSDAQRNAAIALLRDPRLMVRIEADYETCGLVGEATNAVLCYLACVSRLFPHPLAILIQSGSAAGKTSLMDTTLAFMPPEHTVRYSAMTGQSLYYMGCRDLQHKILSVSEEEGVAQASYALKLLQSDGKLRIAAAGKNSGSGRQQTETYEVQGPVMMFLTTTAEEPDAELQNRCLVLRVNESPQQTDAIQHRQRAAFTLPGQALYDDRLQILDRHQNAQRLLQPLPVVIPWAEQLTFRHDQTRMRREHAKYLVLIAAITLLHQYQRIRGTRTVNGDSVEYLVATLEDVELANRLTSEVMGQTLDGLLPQTRQLLILIDDYIAQRAQHERKPRSSIRFTQRELREALGWSDFSVRRHLARLVELEFVLSYRTSVRNQREYQLLYDGQGRNGRKFVLGLADIRSLPSERDPHLAADATASSLTTDRGAHAVGQVTASSFNPDPTARASSLNPDPSARASSLNPDPSARVSSFNPDPTARASSIQNEHPAIQNEPHPSGIRAPIEQHPSIDKIAASCIPAKQLRRSSGKSASKKVKRT